MLIFVLFYLRHMGDLNTYININILYFLFLSFYLSNDLNASKYDRDEMYSEL